ncbi:MAG TPA: type II secretion system F family protein [Aggregatilinea sp.]|jgi:tight adherence protein B|uniref:type II secretion system F family protein n=1 Tax=Aggregatilinea sp. TaxID=2806333 RepID=UPI002B741ECC|nr:type II secretion system F family protein [Aggregatilinea sp.]HML20050.1 type II secretion system F family protein [Aggregatilinea sp.]
MGIELIIAGVAGIMAVAILIFGVVSLRSERQTEVEERLGRYTSEYSSLLAQFEEANDERLANEPGAITQRLDSALADREFAKKWRTQLARADLKLTVGEYFALHIIAGIATFFVGWLLIFGNPIGGAVAGFAGLFFPRFYVARKQGQRLRSFEGQLPDTLSLWVNALRSGYSVLQAMEAIGRESPDPTSTEFKRVVQEVQLGIPMEAALDHLLVRLPSEDMDLVNTAVNIQREVGGNLAEILESISHTIRDRIKLKGEIRVLTSQGRVTGWIISGLPILLTVFLYFVSPDYTGRLVENRLCGWPMIGVGLGLIGSGAAVIQKIVNIEY